MDSRPGPLVLFGSGETSATGRAVFEDVLRRLPSPVRVAILETPAGFQPNSALVARRIAEFLQERLANLDLDITIVPARRRGSAHSPDDATLVDPILAADCIFLGPGSPTYAVRQLRQSVVWDAARLRFAEGAALVLASAAVLAISAHTLPVYEIFKAGADPGWEHGLDLLGPAGPAVAFVPHWNNREGGAELDTSHCFMGKDRFDELRALLPRDVVVVGIDEHTALMVDAASSSAVVKGRGGVTVERRGDARRFAGGVVPLDAIGGIAWSGIAADVPADLRQRARSLREQARPVDDSVAPPRDPPPEVLTLVERRETARRGRDWAAADGLRAEVARLGYEVQDTPAGPRVRPRGWRTEG